MTDPIWWFFLFWLPKFLNTNHGLHLTALGPPLVVIYNAACVGSIAGGWLAARFLKAGWTVNRARKTTMLLCALTVVPIIAAANVRNLWTAVALVSLATAGHQGWSANTFTGWMLQITGSYIPMFVLAGSAYLVALLIIHLLSPQMEPVRLDS
jgi:ACS family hexuronate transporter-like MFS transporter